MSVLLITNPLRKNKMYIFDLNKYMKQTPLLDITDVDDPKQP